jgi:hypothetical protein
MHAQSVLDEPFDFILAHGIFSWVPDETRDALFRLCARSLCASGLLYLNYNALPGWNVRGLVRAFLRKRTDPSRGLEAQATEARTLAATLASALAAAPEHPYMKLMQREFQFVCEGDPSYVAHEFLAPDNRAYWRSEFLALAAAHGLGYVADADFHRDAGRVPAQLVTEIEAAGLGEGDDDLLDLVTYRQLHSPIFTHAARIRRAPSEDELDALFVAASLAPSAEQVQGSMLQHGSGFRVEVRDAEMLRALAELSRVWPRGLRVSSLLGPRSPLAEDLRLLHTHGLVELRVMEPDPSGPSPELLNQLERAWGGYTTDPYHSLARA